MASADFQTTSCYAEVVFAFMDILSVDLKRIPAHSIEEGLKIATDIVKKTNYTVTVIPDGVSIITSVKE